MTIDSTLGGELTVAGDVSKSAMKTAFDEANTDIAAATAGTQPADATLTALAALVTAADKLIYATGSDAFTTANLTAAARSLLDDASVGDMRTTLGLAIGTDVQAFDAVLSATTASFTTADETKLDAISGTNTGDESAASDSASGIVELATAAETTTGTDTARAVTPDGLAGSDFGKTVCQILVFDDETDTAVADGAGDVFFRIPATLNGQNLVAVAAQVQTSGTTGTTDVQIHNVTQAADMLTTKLTIDSGETDTSTAATAAVIDTANDDVATGDQIRIDVDAVSTTAAKGLIVELTFQLP